MRALLLPATALLMLVGCESGEPTGMASGGEDAEDAEQTSEAYQVVLGNAISDTLRGGAGFGLVFDQTTRKKHFVIRLSTGFDFAGGFVMARPDTTLPEPGQYELRTQADSLAGVEDDSFLLFYREGMIRNLTATSGSLTLSTVTDTLIVGRFDATLRGMVAGMEREADAVEVHAVGEFRANPDLDGYIIGL